MAHCAKSPYDNVALLTLHTAVDKQEHVQMHEPTKKLIQTIVFKTTEYSSHFMIRKQIPNKADNLPVQNRHVRCFCQNIAASLRTHLAMLSIACFGETQLLMMVSSKRV